MWVIADALNMNIESFGVFAAIIPLGVLATIVPLAPGGMGIGHVAFDQILSAINIDGGANLFNIYFLGQITLNLIGAIPYIILSKKKKIKSAKTTEAGEVA